jgi:hypothetical protein
MKIYQAQPLLPGLPVEVPVFSIAVMTSAQTRLTSLLGLADFEDLGPAGRACP